MQTNDTEDTLETLRRFNQAFAEHDMTLLADVIAADCVMETMQPAPNGVRYEGFDVNLAFWTAMAADRANYFETEDTVVMGEHATIRWRYHFADGSSVRGVSLMRVRGGKITEALAYAKVPGELAPLPKIAP